MAGIVEVLSESKILREVVMIFLTVGNWHKGFDRLVKAVDELVESGAVIEKVVAQTGHSSYTPRHLKVIDYCSPVEFTDIIAESRIIITHAGVGTICQALVLAKPVIVVPRKSSLGEHVDDHQFTTAKKFEEENKILVAYEISELPDKIEQAKNFVPAKSEGNERIIQAVRTFLEKIADQKGKR